MEQQWEHKPKMKFVYSIIVPIFLFLLLVPIAFAITFTGTSGSDTYSSTNTAQGSIAERQASGTDSESIPSSGIVFSWGAPLGNGSNILGTDTYIITMGPVLEEEEIVIKDEGGAAVPAPPVPAIPSSGGGGAGPSGKQSYSLVVGDKLTVLVKDQPHTIAIDKVGEDYVMVTVQSTAQTLKIFVGETKLVDLDADSNADVYITLNSVSDLRKVQINVEEIETEEQEELMEKAESVESLKQVTGAVAGLADKIEIPSGDIQELRVVLQTATPYIGLVMLGLLLSSLFTAKYVQQRRLYALSAEQEKEELVQEELQKLYIYTQHALAKGCTQDAIKTELLHTGWREEEINTALVDAILSQENRLNQIL